MSEWTVASSVRCSALVRTLTSGRSRTVSACLAASPVAVLSRSPLGVASSFRRSSLFTRWDYRPRYQQMITMTRSGQEHRYATLIPDDDPPGLVALTRLQVLNTVLLAAAVECRDIAHIPYEAAVRSDQTALAELVRVVPELAGQFGMALKVAPTSPPQAGVPDQEDGIYSTATGKEELVAYLSETEAGAVQEATAAAVTAAASVMSAAAAGQAAAWLGGGQHYRLG